MARSFATDASEQDSYQNETMFGKDTGGKADRSNTASRLIADAGGSAPRVATQTRTSTISSPRLTREGPRSPKFQPKPVLADNQEAPRAFSQVATGSSRKREPEPKVRERG
jgi:hypothetical protein